MTDSMKDNNFPNFSVYTETHKNEGHTNACLDEIEFALIIIKPCHFCEAEGVNEITRLDPKKGFESGNCVACCKLCSDAKVNLTEEVFSDWQYRLAKRYLSCLVNDADLPKNYPDIESLDSSEIKMRHMKLYKECVEFGRERYYREWCEKEGKPWKGSRKDYEVYLKKENDIADEDVPF